MGNTDSKLAALYRDQVVRLARPDGETTSVVPLVQEETELKKLVALYLNKERGCDLFNPFYVDFVSSGNTLTMELFNTLVSPTELSNIITVNATNFINLLRYTALQVVILSNSLDASSTTLLEGQLVQLLVCIRILTKMVPVYLQRRKLQDIFWTRNSNHIFGLSDEEPAELPPLGLLLVRALVKLLFIEGFTIASRGSPGSFTHLLWENGVSTQDTIYHHQSPVIDSNRLEILNLVLAMCSSDLYQPRDFIPEPSKKINRFLFCLTTLTPEYDLICTVASIINLVCRFCSNYQEETTIPYHDLGYKQNHQQHLPALRHTLVLSSLQLLNLMCYNDWNRAETFKFTLSLKLQSSNDIENLLPNMVLSYLTTFNREFDLKLILTSFAKIFKLPVDLTIEQESNPLNFLSRRPSSTNLNDQTNTTNNQESTNENNDSTTLPPVSPLLVEWLILFTRLLQMNKCFENYVADKIANRLIIFSVYYLNFYNDVPEISTALIPLCSNLTLMLSSRKLVLSKLLDRFTPNYYTNKIPNFFKLSTGNINNITYRDFTLIHLCNMAISDIKNNVRPRPWLFELIYNILPIPLNLKDEELAQLSSKRQSKALKYGGLSYNASMTLVQLISKMSNKKYLTTFCVGNLTKSYLTCPGFKLDLLALTLRAVLVYIYLYFDEALNLVFAITRHLRVFSQVRDSIDAISKALSTTGIVEGVGKIQMHDYVEYVLNPRLLQDDVEFDQNDSINNSNSNESSAQNLFFDKEKKKDDDDDDDNDGGEEESTSIGELSAKEQSLDGTEIEISKVQSNVKTCEIYEQADMSQSSIFSDKTLFNSFRPQLPVGITSKSKAKLRASGAFSKSWVGADTLRALIRAIRVILHQHPSIATITTTDYYTLIDQISQSKDKFKQTIIQALPVSVREMKEADPIKINLSESNFVYQKWLQIIIWSDILNTHSGPYSLSPAFTGLNSANNGTNLTKEPTMESITPTMPHLERWNSNGSTLSRTNSNNSSLLSYFSTQNHEAIPNSPLELNSSHHVTSPQLNNSRNKNATSGNGHSFFRFSWTGFNKNEEYSPINEEECFNGKPSSSANNPRRNVFTLDPGILKPNAWAGTQVRLFNIRRQEKEEFSLLDMTSSLLKRFKFASNASVNSLDTITPNSTPAPSRPYTPRDSFSSNHTMFSTPKQL